MKKGKLEVSVYQIPNNKEHPKRDIAKIHLRELTPIFETESKTVLRMDGSTW